MCIAATRPGLLSRASFFGAASLAALPLFTEPARALDALQSLGEPVALPELPPNMSVANAQAASIARRSPYVRAQYGAAMTHAQSIGDAKLRTDVLGLLADPRPRYAEKYLSPLSRMELRDRLADAKLVAENAPVEGIFPAGTYGNRLVQPFWVAPGSNDGSHHAYPGGLLGHELFNSRMAAQFASTYDAVYFDDASKIDRDVVIAAAFYHDIMKTVVFQYNDDGTLFPELEIGATGGHHCLSGAEAIVRGHDARFVTVLLSAHAAPSLGDEAQVVTWCRAAAMIAGVDPVQYGLLARSSNGYRLAALPPVEAFVNHLSDHDYVLSVHAMHEVLPHLDALAAKHDVKAGDEIALRWWRLEVLARGSAVGLYYALTRGDAAFEQAVSDALKQ